MASSIRWINCLGTTALSFTGIPAWGMALVGAGTGFGQYAMDCGFHNKEMTWLGAGTATFLGGIFGFAGGPGVRNTGNIAKKMVGLSDDGSRAIGAITNAANRRFFGEISERGMQATLNLYSKTAFNAVQAAIPGTIRHLMIKSFAPVIILPIVNLITSIGVGHVYNRLGWC